MISFSLWRQVGVNLGDVFVRQLLQFLLGVLGVVFGDAAVVAVLLELLHGVAPDVADGHAAILGHLADDLDELLAPLLAEFGEEQADGLALNGRA